MIYIRQNTPFVLVWEIELQGTAIKLADTKVSVIASCARGRIDLTDYIYSIEENTITIEQNKGLAFIGDYSLMAIIESENLTTLKVQEKYVFRAIAKIDPTETESLISISSSIVASSGYDSALSEVSQNAIQNAPVAKEFGKVYQAIEDTENSIKQSVEDVLGGASEAYDTLKEIEEYIEKDEAGAVVLAQNIAKNAKAIEDSPFEKGDAENSAVLKGGNNQVISEYSVALGKGNLVGLKGFYYKAIQFNTTNNITFLYLTKTQQVPIIVTSASNVEQEKDIVVALSNNDIVSVVNDSKYDNKYKVSTNEISTYGRIGLKSVDSNIPFPFDKVNTDDDLNNGIFDPEDYSIYCFQKPNIGIADIGQDSFASGYNNKATNGKATAFGYDNHAYGKFSFVEGRGNEAGYAAHAEGRDCAAKGEMSHAGGLTTHANGKASFSHGQDTRANGYSSFAMGYAAKANGDQSISLGYNTSAEGAQSVALGNNTQAIGNVSHAENAYTVAEGRASHAEGFKSKVRLSEGSLTDNYERSAGYAAHAEGHTTQSIGCAAHSEGGFTTALGNFTHAEGYRTHAKGSLSHSEGKYTKTTNEAEHAEGKYNKSNTNTLHSVGIGTSDTDRKNAHEITTDGRHHIYDIGGYDGTNPTDSEDLATVVNNKAEKTDIVQSDYNQNDVTAKDYIKNKPFYEDVILEDYYEHDTINIQLKYLSTVKIVVSDATVGILPTMILDSSNNYTASVNGSDQYYTAILNTETLILTIQETNLPQLNIVSVSQIKEIDEQYIPSTIVRQSEITRLESATNEKLTELSERIDNLPKGDEFDKEGNYPSLHVGTADDLAGRGESVPASFGFRASGGKSIKDGRAYIKRIKGNSVVWNQLTDSSANTATKTENGVTFTKNEDGSFSVVTDSAGATANTFIQIGRGISVINAHKYVLYGAAQGGAYGTYNACITSGFAGDRYDYGAGVFGTSTGGYTYMVITIKEGCVIPTSIRFAMRLIDLTQMFGAGNEPTTIEEYNARKPIVEDEYAYNEGQVIHCNTESIKSVGDNAWDEEWEVGGIASTTGNNTKNESVIRSINYIPVIESEEYYINALHNTFIFCYDKDKNYIGLAKDKNGTSVIYNEAFILLQGTAFIRFYTSTPTYNNDIMITLVHSGWKQDTDAGYQPYWQDTLPLPIIRKYFPDGMKSAGAAHDEIRYNKASGKWEKVVRIGEVDLGSLTWDDYAAYGFYATIPSDMMPGYLNYLLQSSYTKYADYPDRISWEGFDKAITNGFATIGTSWQRYLVVKDSSYTDAATFKAAMQGVMLYYELAEPIVTELDAEDQNFRDYYNVADFGTEQSQSSVPSAAFSADIIYQFNAVDMIREHELEITELQSIIATMQAQLTSLINGGQ